MDLRFSPEENAFRQELRSFFRSAVPESIRTKVSEDRHISKAEWVTAHKALHAKGLAVPHWPREWGGADWTPVQHYIYTEELQYNGVPQPLPFNVAMCGPVVIAFGTEEQKKRFLPRMASLDDWWCQGFSEPGAGSDLAGLTTTAVRQGNDYVVNGRRPGPRWPSTPTGSSASCAPIPAPRSSSASPSCSWI
jgi:alkylation response protein AidB-like acyl-CoA dehydrogenase